MGYKDWPSQSAVSTATLIPNDNTDIIQGACRALYVGTTGNIQVTDINGNVTVFSNVPVGVLPVAVKRLWATNTTASNIVGLF